MTTLHKAAQDQLRQFIEQIERLTEEQKALAADIRDKFAEAKGTGFDVKAMRTILKMRQKSKSKRAGLFVASCLQKRKHCRDSRAITRSSHTRSRNGRTNTQIA